ncbi:HlyD family efflux transporter periplasmic adaptor subunit [Tsuneonella flava]|uniref:HlyD family efflux transporter periplasmic adaptor subunit n=1 Tax=Tsuneonella flava TaxID=2055955 RepID=UPI001F3A85CE|nr:HlyD family efflux transporter periplasmic adaptor subunit [Tsuneonella flava]
MIIVAVLGALFIAYDWLIGSRTVSTDNAYVQGSNAMVTPLTGGKIVAVPVTETQLVKKGQLLLQIDDTDQKIAVAKAEADLAAARRQYRAVTAQGSAQADQAAAQAAAVAQAQAQLSAAQADLAKAQTDYNRRKSLQGTGAISADELTATTTALQAARARVAQLSAAVTQQQSQLRSAASNRQATLAPISGTTVEDSPAVQQAKAALDAAKLDLERTKVRAPVDGVVSQVTARVGQMIQRGSTAMVVVPVGSLYVDANFKETQLGKVRPGQAVELTSDFYGSDVVYHGKVVGFAGGTGAAFALIPAQNATGNWIKVVQRLPVRIALDPKELAAHPLRVGLSMEAEIDVSDND